MADRNARLFGISVRDLRHFLAPLLVEFRDPDPQDLAFDGRGESQIGIADGLVDGADHCLVPDVNRKHPRLRHADCRHLIERHRLPIGLDMHGFDEARRRASGAQTAQFVLQCRYRALHAPAKVGNIKFSAHVGILWCFRRARPWAMRGSLARYEGETRVALPRPSRAARIAPGCPIEKTIMGIPFSRASANAAVSMTARFQAMASS